MTSRVISNKCKIIQDSACDAYPSRGGRKNRALFGYYCKNMNFVSASTASVKQFFLRTGKNQCQTVLFTQALPMSGFTLPQKHALYPAFLFSLIVAVFQVLLRLRSACGMGFFNQQQNPRRPYLRPKSNLGRRKILSFPRKRESISNCFY